MRKIDLDNLSHLRPVEMGDAECIFEAVDQNRPHLRRWMPWVDATDSMQATELFLEDVIRQHQANDGVHCGIWHEGQLAGLVGFHRIDRVHHQTSIGYWLGAAFEGKGLITRSCEQLIKIAFEEWLLHRVEIRCGVGNHRSSAIPKRLGFTLEGTLRDAEWLYDHFVDLEVYSLLKTEWPKES